MTKLHANSLESYLFARPQWDLPGPYDTNIARKHEHSAKFPQYITVAMCSYTLPYAA